MYDKGYFVSYKRTLSLRKPFIPAEVKKGTKENFEENGIKFNRFVETKRLADGTFFTFPVLTEWND